MNLILFLYIAVIFSLSLGEFGQFPFGQTQFSISITDLLIAFNLTIVLVWQVGIKRNLVIPKHFYLLAGFWIAGFLSLLFSFNFSGWLYLLRFIIYSGIFYLVYHLVRSGILGKEEFLRLIKIVCLTVAILGFIQFIFFPDLDAWSIYGYDPHKNRLFSTFLDPNFAGTFLSFGLVIVINKLSFFKSNPLSSYLRDNRSDVIILGLLLTALMLTFSRSAYLMFFSAVFILFLFKKRLLLIPLFLVPLILYLIFPPFSERINGVITLDKSASERIYSWDKGLVLFSQNPITGIGFNNIRTASEELNLTKTYSADGGNSGSGVDSSLLFISATTGILGVISFSAFLGKIIISFLGNILQKKFTDDLMFFSIFAGLILNSFFINSLFFPAIMVLWFSCLGLYYGLAEGEGEGS